MDSDENKLGAALAVSGVGHGMGALISVLANRPDRHTTFMSRLQERLTPAGIVLLAADLGRGLRGPVWVLTLRLPNESLIDLQAPFDPEDGPREPSLIDAIAQRIIDYLRPRGLLSV